MSRKESFAPLREPNFRWYYAARVASMVGSMMVSVALAFAVLEITDSASALGLVLAAHTIPMVLFLLFGGVIAEQQEQHHRDCVRGEDKAEGTGRVGDLEHGEGQRDRHHHRADHRGDPGRVVPPEVRLTQRR